LFKHKRQSRPLHCALPNNIVNTLGTSRQPLLT
jgi:hypothetical protein